MPRPPRTPKFNMVWRNLDRALSMPVFSKHEAALMQVARELSYTSSVVDGTGRAHAFRVFPGKLAERRGLTRESVSRAVADLLHDNVFLGTRDALRLNKDYAGWGGEHQLTEQQIRECDDAAVYPVTACGEAVECVSCLQTGSGPTAKSVTKKSQRRVTKKSQNPEPGVTKKSQPDETTVTEKSQDRDDKVTAGVTEKSQPPYIGTGAELRVNSETKKDPPTPPEGGVAAAGVPDPQGEDVPPTIPARVKNHPDDVARVKAKALELWPLNGWAEMAGSACNDYPAAWVKEAMDVAVAAGKGNWKYIFGILRRYAADGGPESGRARPDRRAAPPAPEWSLPSRF